MLFTDAEIKCNLFENWAMTGAVFASGAVLHLAMELIGANKWYCKNGNACKSS